MVKLWDYNDAGECVVKNVRALPQPLVHMLANGPQYFAISDNYLRGFSGFDYTRMFGEFDGQNFPKNNGRFLWVRPAGEIPWLANNPFPSDDRTTKQSFEMGLGYARFSATSKALGLAVEATVFVPLKEMMEVWMVTVTNTSSKKQAIDFIPTVPIFGGNRAYTEYHRDVVRLYNTSRVTDHIEILPGLEWVEGKTEASDICYFMAAETSKGKKGNRFYTDRESFLGADYSWMFPEAILKNQPPKMQCYGKEAVGAIEFKNIILKPGESVKVVVLNGIHHGEPESKIHEYTWAKSEQSFNALVAFWKERTTRITITTADKDFSLLWNTWWCYQLSMRYWFGNTGHPQFDYGSDFSGWRDFWQDMMAATIIDPHGLKQRTLHTLAGIRLDGTNATRFFARTKEFGSDEINGLWCDHPYWTTQTVLLLINYLGDITFLVNDSIAYFKDSYRDRGDLKDIAWGPGRIERQKTKDGVMYTGTVLEHLLTQLLTMFYDVGSMNLLRQNRADWNDAVDQVKGENVTFSMGLAQDCVELANFLEEFARRTATVSVDLFEELTELIEDWSEEPIANFPVEYKQFKLRTFLDHVNAEISGRKKKVPIKDIVADLRAKAKVTIERVNEVAWNGEYYTAYFHADGRPVDSIFKPRGTKKKNPTSDDFVMMLMPQTWSLLSEAADRIGAVETVLKSTTTHLADAIAGGALKLNYPPYTKFDKSVGRISGFAAGTKENNALFCHANLFMAWALLRRKRADEAFKIFSGINPLNHPQQRLRTGPWIPEYYISSDNPNYPCRGEYPMLTASGGWTRHLFQNFFFGVRGEIDGLRIDPCLPSTQEFKVCSLSIHFRGADYEIAFNNPRLVPNAKVRSISVDGESITGNLIHPLSPGKHRINVILG